jgi:hypothetical protein
MIAFGGSVPIKPQIAALRVTAGQGKEPTTVPP